MRQIFNIFMKDTRRYWREIAASVALLVAFGWIEVHSWTYRESLGLGGLFTFRFLSGAVDFLTPAAWIFLVVRAIHGESLVGDRQFWLTRPYDWTKLLTAKLLFFVTFINLPLLALDVVLLSRAGFHPPYYIIGLLWMQAMIVLFLVLPAAALATITATIVQAVLVVVIVALYIVGMVALSQLIPSSSFSGPADSVSAFLLIGICCAIVVLQYSRRRTIVSRLLVGVLGVALLLLLVLTPYEAIVARQFRPLTASQNAPFQLSILPGEFRANDEALGDAKEVQMQVPLSVVGLSPDTFADVETVRVGIEGSNGIRWDSGWMSSGLLLFPEARSANVSFALKSGLFHRLESVPVKLQLAFAFTSYRDAGQREFTIPEGQFILENVGRCFVEAGYISSLKCLAPLRTPSGLLLSTDASKSTCPRMGDEPTNTPKGIDRDWRRYSDSNPADFGISPVESFNIYPTGGTASGGVCPGTPLIVSKPEAVMSGQFEIQADNVQISAYREKRLWIGFR